MGTKRDEYVEMMKEQLDGWNEDLDRMEAGMRASSGEARQRYREHVEALRERHDEMQRRLRELAKANESAWNHLQESADKAWHELEQAMHKAWDSFK